MLQQPAAAADVLHYTLCLQVLSDQRWQGRTTGRVGWGGGVLQAGEIPGRGRAFDELARARDGLSCSGLGSRAPVNGLPPTGSSPRAGDALVAYCTARTLTIGVGGTAPIRIA